MNFKMLNSFLGYGDFRKADILVLTKHEGANNDVIKKEIEARTNLFGLEKEYWLDGVNRSNGYYHPSAKIAGEIKNELLGAGAKMDGAVPFVVSYPSRILLALDEAFKNNKGKNIDNWFQPLGTDLISERIKEMFDVIYSDQTFTSFQAALSHYQPLPRQNDEWPYKELDEKEYDNVYTKCNHPENPEFLELRIKREEILAELLRKHPKKLVFSTGNYKGGKDALSKFFEKEFQVNFKYFSVDGKRRGLHGEYTYQGQKTVIIHTQGFAFGGGLSLEDIRKITKRIYQISKE